jgi:NAD+ synthase (glutamine-hydrolysing)
LNREQLIIPTQIIEKPPSAELRPGQVDQDSLPPYDELDAILEGMVCEHKSVEQLVQQGFASETVIKIARLVKRAEFKRRQAPPGLKITDRAFGTGWRMPIASLAP